mgnify:FL=1
MKILYVRLENYIGIFNGRGDNVLEIDLSHTTTPIIVIKGHNGSGKSTLLKALNPIPDSNDQFIPGAEAKKTLVYQINTDIVRIEYLYPVKKDGSRATTKAQVFKNNEPLNLTNNVSDAKEIIYTLFKLDSSFLALSQLTSTDRGLADKRPSERKIFVNSSISGIEEYNNMYKVINKKFSMYKSLINSVVSKINKIGNKQELDISFNRVNRMLEEIIKERDTALASVAKIQAKLDENNAKELVDKYNSLESEIYEKNVKVKQLLAELKDINPDLVTHNMIELRKIEKTKAIELATLNEEIKNTQALKDSLSKEMNELNSNIQKKIAERNTYISTEISTEEMTAYDDAVKELNIIHQDIHTAGLNISDKTEIQNLNELFTFIIDKLQFITDGLNSIDYEMGFDFILKNKHNEETWRIAQDLRNEINSLTMQVNETNLQMSLLESLVEKSEKLKLRPASCKDNTCIFIKDAFEASKQKPNDELIKLQQKNEKTSSILKEKQKQLEVINDCIELKNRFDAIYNKICSYEFLLNKVDLHDLTSIDFLVSIARTGNYKMIKETRDKINVLYNLLELKENYEKTVDLYKDAIDEYNKNKSIIDSINMDIDSSKEKLQDVSKEYSLKSSKVTELETTISKLEPMVNKLSTYIEIKLPELEMIMNQIQELRNNKESLRQRVMQVEEINKDLESSSNIVDQINARYNDILKQRDILSYNKIMIEKYLEELADYKSKYEKLETIRYYVSPTTGIQTVFMGAYMNNIILKANELLSLIFNGQFVIQPFVINESEFRIPCLGSGILNDDISSMSTSQICMISMIISFAMLANADTDYNILKLDEIDGGLDPDNRSQFISLLNSLIQIVDCEQCFLISHNMEYSDKVNVIDMSARPVRVI